MSYNDKERLIVDQDIDQFIIYFEAIFDHPPTVKCFTEYLGANFNGESCQFLECVNEYRKVKHERKRLVMAQNLFERFIAEGSNTQLNLRGDVRNKIQKVLNPNNPDVSSPILISSATRTSSTSTTTTSNIQQTPNSPQSNGSPVPFVSRQSLDSTNSTDSMSLGSESISNIRCKSPTTTTDYSASNLSSNSANGLVNCPKNLFDEVESLVLLSLKENNFKGFVESDYFKQYLKTQPLKVLYEIGGVKEDSQLFYVESLGDLKNESFSINDFKFLKMQFSNYDPNEWEVIGSSKNHKCYFSKKSYDMGESIGLNFFKFDCVFPFNIKHVMNTIFEKEYRLQYDGNLCEIEQLNYVEKKQSDGPITGSSLMASSVTREIYKLVWPFNPREFIVSSSGVFDTSTNTYYVGKKSCVTSKVSSEPKKGVIRAISMGGWAFHAIDENSCRYSQIFYLDFNKTLYSIEVSLSYSKICCAIALSRISHSTMATSMAALMLVAALLVSSVVAQSPASSPTKTPVAPSPRKTLPVPSVSPSANSPLSSPPSPIGGGPSPSPSAGISSPPSPSPSPSGSPSSSPSDITPSSISDSPSEAPSPSGNPGSGAAELNRFTAAGFAAAIVVAGALLM